MAMPDPQNWTRYSFNPTVPSGSIGTWNHWSYACGVDSAGSNLWFTGWNETKLHHLETITQIGRCTSADQLNWTLFSANPIITEGYSPSIVADTSGGAPVYHMYYSVDDGKGRSSIKLSTSEDYINWTDGVVVLQPGWVEGLDSWDAHSVGWCSVMYEDGGPDPFKMWYGGKEHGDNIWNIGYAISNNGTDWTKELLPVVTVGLDDAWDNNFVNNPTVTKVGSTYWMWYHGGQSDLELSIGCASSPDPISWSKVSSSPVFEPLPSGDFDLVSVFNPTVRYDAVAERLYMYYTGWGGGARKTGTAYLDGVT